MAVLHRDGLMGPRRMRRATLAVAVAALLSASGAAAARAADAAGAPGAVATWTEGDKDGVGTATGTASTAWLTIDDGELTEVYAPDLGTPSLRDLQFVVTDGRTFAEREREDATHTVELADPRSLTYRQVNTAASGRWRITKTYVTDPDRGDRAGGRDVRVAHRRAAAALRAARPGAVEHGRRRPRERTRLRAGERGRHSRRGAGERPGADPDLERLHGRERRVDRPALRLHDGLGVQQREGARQRRADGEAAADRHRRSTHATLAVGFGAVRDGGGVDRDGVARHAGSPRRRPATRPAGTTTSAASRGRRAPPGTSGSTTSR